VSQRRLVSRFLRASLVYGPSPSSVGRPSSSRSRSARAHSGAIADRWLLPLPPVPQFHKPRRSFRREFAADEDGAGNPHAPHLANQRPIRLSWAFPHPESRHVLELPGHGRERRPVPRCATKARPSGLTSHTWLAHRRQSSAPRPSLSPRRRLATSAYRRSGSYRARPLCQRA
jgi:hypothetical protein